MTAYFVLLLCPLLLYSVNSAYQKRVGFTPEGRERRDRYTLLVFFSILFILLCLRSSSVGTDLSSYLFYFEKIDRTPLEEMFEPGSLDLEAGYLLLNKLVLFFTKDFQVLLVVCAALSLYPVYRLYRRSAAHPLLLIALFLTCTAFSMYFSALRQVVAMGITLFAYDFIKKKKPLLFLVLVVLASLFHVTALVFLIAYPLYYVRIKPKAMLFCTPFFAILLLGNSSIFSFLSEYLPEKFKQLYGEIEQTNSYNMLILLAVFALFCFIFPDERAVDRETAGLRNFLIPILIIQCFVPVSSVIMRINYFFLPFLPIIVARVLDRPRETFRPLARTAELAMTAFFFAYFIYDGFFGADILNVFPYEFFFSV